MNRLTFAAKLYMKTLLEFGLVQYAFSVFNLLMILIVATAFIREHHSVSDAMEVASVVDNLLYILIAIPFITTALGLLIQYGLLQLGYELPDELWPEVDL